MGSLADEFLDDVDSSYEGSSLSDRRLPSDEHSSPSPPSSPARPTPAQALVSEEADVAKAATVAPPATPPALFHRLEHLHARINSAAASPSLSASAGYDTLVDCASATAEIDDTLAAQHRQLIRANAPHFPELDTLILNALDYARVARATAEHADLSQVDLRAILPSAAVISVQVTASSSKGRALTQTEICSVKTLADAMLQLDASRVRLLQHLEQRAGLLAPNLAALVGGAVAASLLAHAGGLAPLAAMPGGNLKLVGKPKRGLHGASSASVPLHNGVIYSSPLVTSLPPKLRQKAGAILAGKASLAARVDSCRGHLDASVGLELHKLLSDKFLKMQQPPPAKSQKPLAVPGDEAKRRHRGGKRARKEKERMGMTELRRLANRQKFGEAEPVIGNDLENDGMGMIGVTDSQRLRIQPKKTDSVSVAARKRLHKQQRREGRNEADRLGITSHALLDEAHDGESDETRAATAAATAAVEAQKRTDASGTKASYFSAVAPFLGVDKSTRAISKHAASSSHKMP